MIAKSLDPVPARINRRFASAVILVNLLGFIGLPMAIGVSSALLTLMLVFFVLSTVPHWALIHEAIHGHLLAQPQDNRRYGRMLAMLFGAPFETLKFGHLSHHALNARTADRPEMFDRQARGRWRAQLVYYFRLLFGLYFLEVSSGPMSLLPRPLLRRVVRRIFYDGSPDAAGMADRAERQLLEPSRLARIRTDAVCVIGLLSLSLWLYGVLWKFLVAALLGRAFLVSFMDNAPHYDGPLAVPDQGYDMQAPSGVQLMVLNSNFHGVHHTYPNLPWTELPSAFARDGRRFHGRYLITPWRQLRGPIPAPAAALGKQASEA